MKISNKLYDVLKWVAIVLIPALIVLVNAVGCALGVGCLDIITSVIAAIGIFIGTVIGMSSINYTKEISQAEAMRQLMDCGDKK